MPADPAAPFSDAFSQWGRSLAARLDRFVPPDLDADDRRRAQLFIVFSVQGLVFGLAFAGFYLGIGHPWGALVVAVCTLSMGGAPWLVRYSGLERTGNIYAGVLVAGFSALTAMEGGLHGHAVAWLAVVPLCACLLVNQRTGWLWCLVCLTVLSVFCGLEFAGVRLHPFYPDHWDATVTVAGYVSLMVFMACIGIFFERGRRRSLAKLREALDALAVANGRLADIDKERRSFLSIAAHDLRNPLNAIMGFAQLMRDFDPPTNAMHVDAVGRIISGGTRMRDLLDRLLSVQAIEEGKLRLKPETHDLGTLARTAVDNHQLAAGTKGIPLSLEPPPDGSLLVRADRNATLQVLDNLLSNALKFSPKGQPVVVRVVPSGATDARAGTDSLSVEVRDYGPGLSEEDQRKLYGKFQRLSAQPTGGESSTGLGLSIVKRLAEEMGGALTCRSRLGEGATFALTLPRAEAARVG